MALDPSGVQSREEFVQFVTSLASKVKSGDEVVTNSSTWALLEAAAGWVGDLPGWHLNRGEKMPETPTWSLMAWILYAALVYE